MPRKANINSEEFDKAVGAVFEDYATTEAERAIIAQEWRLGHYDHHVTYAQERGLLPIALLTASLLETEHPLLVEEGLLKCRSLLGCAVIILTAQIHQESVHTPLCTACVQPVYNLWITQSYPQASGTNLLKKKLFLK